MILVSL